MTQATHTSSHDSQGKYVLWSARANKAEAQRVFDDLERAGLSCWMDWHDLLVGRDWDISVRDAIRGSRGLLLIATPESAQSPNVRNELSMAWANDLPIYPLWLAGERYETCVHPDYKKLHALDLRGDVYATGLARMIVILTGQEPARAAEDIANAPPRNPYKGLQAFRYEDRDLFFGRRGFVADLVNKLRAQPANARLLAVIGASGSGKSSAVMAGLLPALRAGEAGELGGSVSWVYLDPITPTAQPLEQLAIALSRALPARSTAAIEEDLAHRSCRGLHRLAAQMVTMGNRVVLIVDQFEELFTLCRDVQEREQFLNLITLAATEPNGPLQVVLTLRADFTDKALAHPALCALLQSGTAYVPPLSLADLVDAIKRPAELPGVGLRFDEGLVNEIAFDVTDRTGALPLLQFALDELYRRREGNMLTRAAYEAMGRIKGALAQRADEIYENVTQGQRDRERLIRVLFSKLVSMDEDRLNVARRRTTLNDLALADSAQSVKLRTIAEIFVQARLLTTSRLMDGNVVYEVSHEALLTEWVWLVEWTRKNREALRIYHELDESALLWEKHNHNASYLYTGLRFEITLSRLDLDVIPCNVRTTIFLSACQTAHEERLKKEATERKLAQLALRAKRSKDYACIAMDQMFTDPVRAILIALEAVNLELSCESTDSLREAIRNKIRSEYVSKMSFMRPLVSPPPPGVDWIEWLEMASAAISRLQEPNFALEKHKAFLQYKSISRQMQLALSMDSQVLVTANADGQIDIWKLNRNAEGCELLHRNSINCLDIGSNDKIINDVHVSPDGQWVATAKQGLDEKFRCIVQVWSAASGQMQLEIHPYRGDKDSDGVVSVRFSPNNQYLVTTTEFSYPEVWNAFTGQRIHRLANGHWSEFRATFARFSSDGAYVLAIGGNQFRLWHTNDGELVASFHKQLGAVYSANFSPDDKEIVVAHDHHMVSILDIKTQQVRVALRGHTHKVLSATFSPDGSHVITASNDGTARIWDAVTGRQVSTLIDHEGSVNAALISADGKFAFTAGNDGCVFAEPVHAEDLIHLARHLVTREMTCAERVEFLHEDLDCT